MKVMVGGVGEDGPIPDHPVDQGGEEQVDREEGGDQGANNNPAQRRRQERCVPPDQDGASH